MSETAIGALAVRIGGDASGLINELGRSKTALGSFGDKAKQTAKSAAQITGAIAAAGAAIFAFANKVATTGDQFDKMSLKVGASTEFLSAFAHAVKLGGGSVEGMEKSLGRMARTMSDAQNGLTTAQRTFDDLGVKVQNADGSLREVPDVILEIADRLAGMTDETKQAALAQEAFGRSGLDMLPVLKEGSVAIRAHMEEARRLGVVWTSEAARDAVIFKDNVERLEGAVEGLSMKLAGPLIKALGDASGAMLEAQRRSQGFFASLAAGFRSILTGDDATKWQREFSGAVDKLLFVQNQVDKVRQQVNHQGAEGLRGHLAVLEKDLAAAQANVNRLLSIKDIIAPEVVTPTGKPKGASTAPPPRRGKDADKELGEAFNQGEAAEGSFERVLAVAEAIRELDEEERARKKAHLDEMTRIELEAAMQQGEIVEGAAERDRVTREQMYEIARQQRELEKRSNADFWNNLAGLMNTGSKKAFDIGKKFAIGQAAVKGTSAVMSAWEAGMSTGGPWAPFVAAAYAAAAGLNALNMMNNIKSQQFGGGGGAPVHPTQGASGVSPVGAGGGQQSGRGESMTHVVKGIDPSQLFTGRQIRELLNEGTRDGDRWVFA